MLTLLFLTCLANGTDCRPTTIAGGFNNPMGCFLAGMEILPTWAKENPDRVYSGMLCTNYPEVFYKGKEI